MKKLLLPFYLIPWLAAAQSIQDVTGTSNTGLGAYSHQFTQTLAFLSNQAALGNLPQTSAGLYAEQKYGLKELGTYMAAVAMPVGRGGLGVAMQYAGFSDFNHSRLSLAYGKNLGRINVGIQFNYNLLHIAAYGNDAALGFEAASQWQVSPKLITGIHISNPPVGTGKFRNNSNEKLASVYELGAGYEVSQQLFISAEIRKVEDKPVTVQAGIQYNILEERLLVRTGWATATGEPWLSIGCRWKNYRADISLRYHSQLGFTPGVLLLFYGKRKSER